MSSRRRVDASAGTGYSTLQLLSYYSECAVESRSNQLPQEALAANNDAPPIAKCAPGQKVFAYYAGSIQGEQGPLACMPEREECWFPAYLDLIVSDGTCMVICPPSQKTSQKPR